MEQLVRKTLVKGTGVWDRGKVMWEAQEENDSRGFGLYTVRKLPELVSWKPFSVSTCSII